MKSKLSKKREAEIRAQFGGKLPTPEEIFQKIAESQERMTQALKGAYESAPDDPKQREQLIDLIDKSVKLKEKIKKTFKTSVKKSSK